MASVASMGQHGQHGQRGQRDVTMPSRPGADLVLVEPNLALGGLEAGLNRPARAGDLDKGGKFCALRRERQIKGQLIKGQLIKGQLIRLLERAPDQERFLPALTSAPERDTRPVIQARPLGPVAGRSAASSHPWAPPWPSPRPAAGQGAAPRGRSARSPCWPPQSSDARRSLPRKRCRPSPRQTGGERQEPVPASRARSWAWV